MLILFLKAEQLGLFDVPVTVGPYTRKDGVTVGPHTAIRRKHIGVAPAAQQQLFGKKEETKRQEQRVPVAAQAFAPTHELPDGTRVVAHPDEPGVWVDEKGDEYEDDNAYPLEAEAPKAKKPATKKPVTSKPEPKIDTSARHVEPVASSSSGLDYDRPFGEIKIPDFGVPAGTTKAERRNLNAQARAIIESKTDGFTEAERAILKQYSGTGGVGDSLNEFYTRPDVAAATWTLARNLGAREGQYLETSCGTGVYVATAPAGVNVVGVELDNTSSKIAQVLHPGHEVHNSSLERFATSDGRQFDGVIGNVPFGLRGALIKDDKPELSTAEQYFLDTAIDKTKPGGVVTLIVPTGIMDGKNTRGFRERLLRKAEFLGAHRLPNTAFEHSHTGVTSDIVIFRKRPDDVAGALGTVPKQVLKDLGVWDEEFLSGKYFQGRGKDQIYGRPEEGWRAKAGMGNDFTVTGSMDGVAEAIAGWQGHESGFATPSMTDVLTALGDDEKARQKAISAALRPRYAGAQLGDTKVVDGVTYVLQGDPPRWHAATKEVEEPEAVTDARGVADLVEAQFNAYQGRGAIPGDHRQRLIEALDAYVAKHGLPSANRDLVRAAQHDKTLWRLLGAVGKDGSYSDLVTGRESSRDDRDFNAVASRLAFERGAFTVDDLVNEWEGGDRDAALDHLFATTGYAVEADGKTWTSTDNYLSGELWPKLDAARAALEHEGLESHYRDKYQAQVDALEKAIDMKSLEDVEIAINSGWAPLEIVAGFFDHKAQQWRDEHPTRSWDPEPMVITYGEGVYTVKGGMGERELLEKYLNRSGVRKDQMPTIEAWNREFKAWACASEHREQLEDLYNRKFRGFRQRAYSDAPLEIPGLNPALDINAYHFAGLRWAMETGKGIVADDVGLGKTGRALMLARLSKLHGHAKRPTIVVPKSVLANWVAEAEFWFPGSRVLVIGETYTRDKNGDLVAKTDTAAERNRKFHELSQNEYDFVLISQPVWNELDMDPITKEEFVRNDFWNQRADSLGNAGDKRRKKIREAYEQAIAKRDFEKRTDAIYFNDLGIDLLMLDEGHAYKNLYAARARWGEQPKFLGGTGLSNRALDTNLKTRWVREQNEGKGVFLLSATPTKNSPLEVYSMLSHVAPEAFERLGIKNSEEFLDRYCEFTTDQVLSVGGDIEEALVVSGFKNLNELREVMRRYIDRRTAEDVGLPLPKREDAQHLVPMDAAQEKEYATLRELAVKDMDDADGDGHIFSIMDKMAKAAIDLELLDPKKYGGRTTPKIETAADNIAKFAKEGGGQVVFADHIGVHPKLVKALMKRGLKESEIAIVNAQEADTSAARQNIADKFNKGILTVVIGNTATMGEGMNLQKKTTDIHHLELPWEPASMQQRNGRGLRQGNKAESVRIHSYLSKGSFDGYRYQTMMAKKDWQDLLWHGGDRVENLAREGKFSREEMLIMLSADPEEARKQYDSNKAAALERQAAAGRREAAGEFVRFQDMKRSYASLKDRSGPAARRLASKMEQIRHSLSSNKHFLAKDALDVEMPVVIQSDTGTAWHAGKSFEMDPGKDAPVSWSADKKSRWVVTGVGAMGDGYAVQARPYGETETKPISFPLDKMHRGIQPVEYSAEQERREIASAKAASATRAVVERAIGKDNKEMAGQVAEKMQHAIEGAVEEGRRPVMWHATEQTRVRMRSGILDAIAEHAPEKFTPDQVRHLADRVYRGVLFADANIPEAKNPTWLRDVPETSMREFYPEIQAHLKHKMRNYQDDWPGPYGMLDKDGNAVAFQSYHGRDKVDAHDLMLPTEEHKTKAIDAWIAMEMGKKEKTKYVHGRRSRGSSYAPLKEAGVEEAYPGFEYGDYTGNPWDSIGRKTYGDGFVDQARAEFVRRWEEGKYSSMDEAMAALKPISRLPAYGGHSARIWPQEAMTALAKRGAAKGWLNPDSSTQLSSMAKDSKLYDLAAAIVVSGHKDAGPHAALAGLGRLMESRSVGPTYNPQTVYEASEPVRAAAKKIINESGLGKKTVGEVAGDNSDIAKLLTGDWRLAPRWREATVNEMLARWK